MALRRVSNNIQRRLEKLKVETQKLPAQAHQFFQSITPIDTGNAKRNTDLASNSIVADYNYANQLNTGYSRQAPGGMTKPTIEHIRTTIRKI